jgi:hypothetical protein
MPLGHLHILRIPYNCRHGVQTLLSPNVGKKRIAMDCRKVQEDLLSLYLDDMLPSEEAEAVRLHLESCLACQDAFDQLVLVTSGLRAMGSAIHSAPPELRQNILQRLREEAAAQLPAAVAPIWRRSVIGIAAAALLAIGVYTLDVPLLPTNIAEIKSAVQGPALTNPIAPVNTSNNNQPSGNPADPVSSPEVSNPATTGQPEAHGSTPTAPIAEDPLGPSALPEAKESTAPLVNAGILPSGDEPVKAVLMSRIADTEQTVVQLAVAEEINAVAEIAAIVQSYQAKSLFLGTQQQQGKQAIAQQITVKRGDAPAVLAALSSLGEITSQHTETVSLNARYQELYQQYSALEQSIQTATDSARTALIIQQESVYADMVSLSKQAEEIVIIVQVEQ